jgi:hypothetical protein
VAFVSRLRRLIGVVAIVWLTGQLVTLAIAPAELWTSAANPSDPTCQCADGSAATCPMHHPTAPGRRTCAMRGVAPLTSVALTALLGGPGCLAATPTALFNASTASHPRPSSSNPVSWFVPPDPPPPRELLLSKPHWFVVS